jgi:DnaJ-domain-containing protein 1
MAEILGEGAEPDPLFFVESWTVGVEAAAESFQARHQAEPHQAFDSSTFRTFDFAVPLLVEEMGTRDARAFFCVGFSAAFKNAYGISGSAASKHCAPPQAPFAAHTPGRPLTLEDACRMLGVADTGTRTQIKTAYRQLVRRYHPDRLPHSSEQERRIATDRMISINEAYHLLSGLAAS